MFWTLLLGLAVCALLWWRLSRNTDLDSLPKGGHVFQLITLSTNQIFDKFRENVRVHGDRYMFRGLYRNILHLSGPKDIETILSHPRNISKGKVYEFLEPWLGPGLLISSGTKWHKRRKILTPTFHFNILKNFATVIEEKSRDLVNRLKESESSGDGIDVNIMQVISDCTLYTICETAMGTQLDLEMSEKKTHYKKAILELGPIILDRLPRIWYHWDLFYKLVPIGRRYEQCLTTVRSFADDVIMDKKRKRAAQRETSGSFEDEEFGTKKRLAMLDLLLEAEAKGEIDLQGIRDEVNTFMFEGHDTTAMALTFAFMLLSENQEVQDRIYEELHSVLGDSDRVPNMADMAQLKYLEAVLKETLRLYPSVPFISRTITEEFQLGDLTVPKGTEVAIHFYDLHRRADLFPEPEAFRPERFLNAAQRHPYAFVPFSAGPRNCIGQRFAMQEMKCIVAEVVRGFRLEKPRARSPGAAAGRPRLVADLVLRPVDPIYVRFIKR